MADMPNGVLPSGTVTFVFSDIEGSTRRWEQDVDAMQSDLRKHDDLLNNVFTANGGAVFKHTGDGMCVVFASASSAVTAAAEAQRVLAASDWTPLDELKIRIGVHSGEADQRNGDYFGTALNRVARIMDAGHGGQILISATTAGLIGSEPGPGLSLMDLGDHRFKDLGERDRVYQLVGHGLATDFPRIRSLEAVPNNFPEQLTSFVGRERELAEVIGLIEENRLVTLTGVGGVGKTRLAVQAAAESAEGFADGVFLVELAAIEDPSLLIRAVAGSVGLIEQPTRPLLDTMLDHLAERELLIVLDNCEHVISDAAKLCEQILRSAASVRIVATSREGLAIGGERLWQVPSLGVATDGAVSDAVQLFVERARMIRPGFALEADSEEAVAKICSRLDGIPLAIELATARLKVFSPTQIADRLDDRFRLLTGGSRTALERQRTLQATMDWSYDLLSELEQALLRRLGVFLGGFSFEAAEEVCSSGLLPQYEVLDLLSRLVDHSLVIADEDRQIRYRVLETVRQYGLQKLVEAGESDEARLRHAEYYAAIADLVEERLLGDEYRSFVELVDTEHDNFRASMTWALEHDHPELALRTAAGLGRFWFFRAHYREGREWLERAVAASFGTRSKNMAQALGWIAGLGLHMGDYVRSREASTAAVAMFEDLGDETGAMRERNSLANVYLASGRIEEARETYDRVMAFFDKRDDHFAHIPMVNRAMVASWQGDRALAAELIERLREFADRLDNPEIGAWTALIQGDVAALDEDADTMADAYQRALDHALDAQQRLLEGWAYVGLADVARMRGAFKRAHELLATASAAGAESGAASVEWVALVTHIDLAADERDPEAFTDALNRLLTKAMIWKDTRTLAMSALGYALELRRDDPAGAVRLLGLHEAAFAKDKLARRPRHERLFQGAKSELRIELGHTAFDEAWSEGAAISPLDVATLMPHIR
jgi:predicted ATPase/class 3 adenylate cyclase